MLRHWIEKATDLFRLVPLVRAEANFAISFGFLTGACATGTSVVDITVSTWEDCLPGKRLDFED